MSKSKTYKCGYKYCLHDNEVSEEDAILYKNRRYHKDCLTQIKTKEEIRNLYLENINSNEVITRLNGVIHNLIDVKKIDGNFVVYALKYTIKNKLSLHTPMGLSYIINNYKIKQAYEREIAKIKADNIKSNINKLISNKETKFEYKSEDNKLWGDILQK